MTTSFPCVERSINFVGRNPEVTYSALQFIKNNCSNYNCSLSLISNKDAIKDIFSDAIVNFLETQNVELYKLDVKSSLETAQNFQERNNFYLLYDKQKTISCIDFDKDSLSPTSYFVVQYEALLKDLSNYIQSSNFSQAEALSEEPFSQANDLVLFKAAYDTGLIYVPGSLLEANFSAYVGGFNLKTETLLQSIHYSFIYQNYFVDISSPPTPFYKSDKSETQTSSANDASFLLNQQNAPHRLFFIDVGTILHNELSLNKIISVHTFWVQALFNKQQNK